MQNFISLNIKYLCDKNFLNQDEFGSLFELKKGVVGTYVREIAVPKLETLQKISIYFKISIDDFVNRPLSEVPNDNYVKEPESNYGHFENDFIETQKKVIGLLEQENERLRGEILDLKSKKSNSA